MIAPGFSSDRVPLRSRLFFSIALSLVLCPISDVSDFHSKGVGSTMIPAPYIIRELYAGIFLGITCRLFIFAIDSLITAFSYSIGLSNIFNSELTDTAASPVLSTLLIVTSIQLILATDLHHIFIQAAIQSYSAISFSNNLDAASVLSETIHSLSQSYLLVLRLSSPFLIFSVIINLSFAFLSRLSPNYPIYFISGPFVIFLGLSLFKNSSNELLSSLIFSFRQFILRT
jgi:flagellar biosynthetic protein FliR